MQAVLTICLKPSRDQGKINKDSYTSYIETLGIALEQSIKVERYKPVLRPLFISMN